MDFGGFGATFPIVVTPSAVEGANLRQVAIAKATKAQEARVIQELGREFPTVNVISVREQLEAATDLFDRLALAVRGAAAVAALAGLLVLAGAIAARAQARTREAAVLKVLGASRAQILAAYILEYGAVGDRGRRRSGPRLRRLARGGQGLPRQVELDWAGVAALLAAASVVAGSAVCWPLSRRYQEARRARAE